MSLWHIAWSYLWNRKLTTCLTILSVALAVGLISAVLTLREETRKRFEDESQAFDLVVGQKGSPLQLVLSSVYFMDNPTGNINISELHRLQADTEYVQAAFPINLGDTYATFRIVGTVPELMSHSWEDTRGNLREPFKFAEGKVFEKEMEVVIGAGVARQTGLQLGDTFESTHGFVEVAKEMALVDHSEHPYTVVGILKASDSPFDRAIFTALESTWHAHEKEAAEQGIDPRSQVTSVLLQLQSPVQRFEYQQQIQDNTGVMAVVPVNEIKKLYDNLLATVKTIMLAIGYLVVVISAISILIGLYLSILQRKRDLAVMRALGASSFEIFGAVIIEAFWVTMLGIGSGWLIGRLVTYGFGKVLEAQYGLVISSFGITRDEINAFATVALVGLVAGILPAWQAYDSDVASDLAER